MKLGVSAHSVARWRRRYRAQAAGTVELEREVHTLRRELQEVRQQREIIKKSARISSEAHICVIRQLAGEHSLRALCHTLGGSCAGYLATARRAQRPRAPENVRIIEKLVELFEAT